MDFGLAAAPLTVSGLSWRFSARTKLSVEVPKAPLVDSIIVAHSSSVKATVIPSFWCACFSDVDCRIGFLKRFTKHPHRAQRGAGATDFYRFGIG
jgi:hypothetical protein